VLKFGRVVDGKFRTVIAGMTGDQVQRLFGKPAAKRGRCWRYPFQVNKYLASQGVVESDFFVCFYERRVSDTSEQNYVRRRGKLAPYHPQ
jgi:hypothetical protein